ncbi:MULTISPECIES: cysteine hydrolase family protein [unclassified Sphingomonas]|uniref:cysteine hydrolase family protein n=1 Tax=unclassified Sphingomonas TaxID=196159 RepID=UPI0006FC3CA8|nr:MULTISPECIES: cysteine hydrolase [unclassified Sphingomonas]KQX22805.1 isochorismatase [Sphingomonas sp. Root1294]KQY67715.1 isochorismatase [Sphingomonas sp. Root50]KRB88657.1 isochorismatase [Sphingomonas sp. Root720]
MSTAVLALHYQNEVLHPDGRIRLGVAEGAPGREAVIAAAGRLLAAARRQAIPLVHVRIAFPAGYAGVAQNAPIFRNVVASGAMQEGSWGAAFHDGLSPLPGEAVVTHNRVNAFFDSDLERVLAGLAVDRLIMAGVATNSVVEHSARHAADMGFAVAVAADACSAGQPHLHRAALDNIALLGEVSTVADLLEHRP